MDNDYDEFTHEEVVARNAELATEAATLRAQVQQLERRIAVLQKDKSALRNAKDDLDARHGAALESIRTITKQRNDAQEELNELQSSHGGLEDARDEAHETIRCHAATIKGLQKELETAQLGLQHAQMREVSNANERDADRNELLCVKDSLLAANDTIQDLRGKNDGLRHANAALEEELEAFRSQVPDVPFPDEDEAKSVRLELAIYRRAAQALLGDLREVEALAVGYHCKLKDCEERLKELKDNCDDSS